MENNMIKDKLYEFKNITIALIEELKSNNFVKLDELICNRQNIIDELIHVKLNDYIDKEESLSLLELDKELISLIELKKQEAKGQLDSFNSSKNANKTYEKSMRGYTNLFNKKI